MNEKLSALPQATSRSRWMQCGDGDDDASCGGVCGSSCHDDGGR